MSSSPGRKDALAGFEHIESRQGVHEFLLRSNGLRLVLLPLDSVQAVEVAIVYRVGSRNEVAGTTGGAHFLEHMMFRGTRKFDPRAGIGVRQMYRFTGADANAMTSNDWT